jgi:drug/metabolite transporter (DMT)-like permease
VAVFLGTAFAGEALTLRTLLGATLIIGSVALVITAQQLKPKTAPEMVEAMTDPDCAR